MWNPLSHAHGASTLRIEDLFLLAKSVADVPFGKTHGDKTSYSLADREVRRQKRYLDWITNPASQERFKTAGRVLSLIRRFLEGDGFLEVATPRSKPCTEALRPGLHH